MLSLIPDKQWPRYRKAEHTFRQPLRKFTESHIFPSTLGSVAKRGQEATGYADDAEGVAEDREPEDRMCLGCV